MSSRSRWKSLAVLAAVMAVGVVGSYLFLARMGERKEFVGKVDPASGLRCRYTVASGWGHNIGQLLGGSAANSWKKITSSPGESHWELDAEWFTAPPPLPIQEWIDSHLGRRPNPGSPSIDQRTYRASDLSKSVRIQDRYPEAVLSPRARLITRSHLRIDGYPATVDVTDVPYYRYKGMFAYIYVPDQRILYAMYFSAPASEFAPLEREMQAIIASFHIEKVTGGKQGIRP
ncbi:MAG: hypothetical protein JWL77_4165 [Chthonomonadaceae bacterium]|nr:hypothetical protein [Chthonomonadaceae bacterium]